MTPSEALAAYRDELAAAGVRPNKTKPHQEFILQVLSGMVWQEELEEAKA